MATAAEVLEGGGYRSLPAAIEELRPAPPPSPAARAAALRLMDQMLRSRLLQVIPSPSQTSNSGSGCRPPPQRLQDANPLVALTVIVGRQEELPASLPVLAVQGDSATFIPVHMHGNR